MNFEAAHKELRKQIGMKRDKYAGPAARRFSVSHRRDRDHVKILCISDLHAPFQRNDLVAEMLERDGDADVAVVMGDITDHYGLSRFTKYEDVPYERGLAETTALMELFSERFPRVVLIEGNHDGPRFEKWIRERLSSDFVKAIKAMAGGTLSPVEAIAKRYPNVEIAAHTVGELPAMKWFTQIGDAMFMHAEKYSTVPGSALRGIEDWWSNFEEIVGVQPYKVIVQAHTHTLLQMPWKANKWLIECGCLCQTHGYQMGPRIGGRPQRQGYVTLEQTAGVTDPRSIRMVPLNDIKEPETADVS